MEIPVNAATPALKQRRRGKAVRQANNGNLAGQSGRAAQGGWADTHRGSVLSYVLFLPLSFSHRLVGNSVIAVDIHVLGAVDVKAGELGLER